MRSHAEERVYRPIQAPRRRHRGRWIPLVRRVSAMPLLMGALGVCLLGVAACGSGAESPTGSQTAGPSLTTAATSPGTSRPVSTTAAQSTETVPATAVSPVEVSKIKVTVIYDNRASREGLRADWGFSCLIEGPDKTVLFDTGKDGTILLHNMQVLGISPDTIDVVVLSHDHSDHTGGLAALLAQTKVTVYCPAAFSDAYVRAAETAGAAVVLVSESCQVCPGVWMMGPMGDPKESGLVVETQVGQVLLTGCAHPGLIDMVTAASATVGEPMWAVIGGFHLMSCTAEEVDGVVRALGELGVQSLGPAHCTGEVARERIAASDIDNIDIAAGSVVEF